MKKIMENNMVWQLPHHALWWICPWCGDCL